MNAPHISMPPLFAITCRRCGAPVAPQPWQWRHHCGGTLRLEVGVDPDRVAACATAGRGLTRFAPLLPLRQPPPTEIGDTPLSGEDFEGVRVHLKQEYLNLGGSFKDRGAYVTLARCAELGFESVVMDSSGNAGVASALIGLRLGIRVDVFLPSATPEGKKRLLRVLGATLHEVDGDRMTVHSSTLAYAEARGAAYVGHWWNPYFAHGVKTMAYESVEQTGGFDYLVSPVGAGTVLLGMHTGLSEMVATGHIRSMPRIVAVQAAGFSPVCAELGVAPASDSASRLADGIAIAQPPRRSEMVAIIRQTKGFGVVVTDDEIAFALGWLIARGYVVEPTSAVALAGLFRCVRDGRVRAGQSVLLPLTGTGMKVLDELEELQHGLRANRRV